MQEPSGARACPDAEFSAYPDGTTVTDVDLGEVNFGGYTAVSAGRSLVSGEQLPGFSGMPEKTQHAWRSGARAVVRHVVRHGELTKALAALRRLADPAEFACPFPCAEEAQARLDYAARAYAALATAAGQLGLDDDRGDGRPAGR